MNNFLYEELAGKGFDSSQINQLLSIAKNMDIYEALLYIKPDTDVDVLRSLNIYLKNKDKYEEWDFFDKIIDLVKANVSFQEIFDISENKMEYVCEVLLYEEFDKNNLKYFKCENIDEHFICEILVDDLKNGIDISLYYRPEFNRHQLYAARDLVEKGMPELVDVILPIKETGVVFNDTTYYNRAKKVGLDLIELLNKTKDSDITKKVINLKEKGIDITKHLDKIKTYSDCTFYTSAVKNGLSETEILDVINLGIKDIDYDDLDKYMQLYKDGIDIQPFIENNCSTYYLSLVLPLANKINLYELADKEEFVINAIYNFIEHNREDLIDIVLNLNEPDEDTFYFISKILEEDEKYGRHHKIINLFYDKGADALEDYDYCFEFDAEQKRALSYAILTGILNDENIDLIRDNTIDPDKMSLLAEIISNGNDVSILLSKIDELSEDEIQAAGICLNCGFKLVLDEKIVER